MWVVGAYVSHHWFIDVSRSREARELGRIRTDWPISWFTVDQTMTVVSPIRKVVSPSGFRWRGDH
jgi:hypothetical protein